MTRLTGNGYVVSKAPVDVLYDREQLRKIFMNFDSNQDKILSKDEIKKAFEHLGAMVPVFRAYRGVKKADANKDGVVDQSEIDELVDYAFKLQYAAK